MNTIYADYSFATIALIYALNALAIDEPLEYARIALDGEI